MMRAHWVNKEHNRPLVGLRAWTGDKQSLPPQRGVRRGGRMGVKGITSTDASNLLLLQLLIRLCQ